MLNTKIAGKTEKKWSLKIEVNRDCVQSENSESVRENWFKQKAEPVEHLQYLQPLDHGKQVRGLEERNPKF